MLVLKTGKANNHSVAYYLAQGARWDLNAGSIAESKLKELYPAMPVMFIKAVTQDESVSVSQGGITCEAIDEPRKSSKAIDKRVIIDFRDKNVVIARFCDKNEVFI